MVDECKERVRVQFKNEGLPDEYLWAEPLSSLRCRVFSVPVVTAGIAPGDEIAVRLGPNGARLYEFTVAMAATRVYLVFSLPSRVFASEDVARIEAIALSNGGKGALVETSLSSAISIAVPSASAEVLAESLERGERDGLWRYVESTFGQPR